MIDRIRRINAALPDQWPLCDFAGKTETETMIFQTLHACAVNYAKHGDTFSFKSRKLRNVTGGGLGDNPAGYRILIERGWVEEQTVIHLGDDDTERIGCAAVGIFPTAKLLDDLEQHLGLVAEVDSEPAP